MAIVSRKPLILNTSLAVAIGINEALVLQQIDYWLEKNREKNINFHEGRYWTYNTINEWKKEFPFWSTSTIKRVFKKLRDMKIVEVDNFNIYQMDRTLWYTINYEELEKIDFFIVEHAINKFKEISREQRIINPLGYLKALIYNSINELEIDIDSRLRYDGLVS